MCFEHGFGTAPCGCFTHLPTPAGISIHRENRGGVSPVFEVLSTLVQPPIQRSLVIWPKTRVERHVVRPDAHIHGIQLDESDRFHHSPEVPHIDPAPRSTRAEPLRAKGYPSRSID